MEKSKESPSVYAQIYNQLCEQIFSGELKPRDMLPSENQLCAQFHTSRETVRKALKLLEGQHIITSRPKVGYFVNQANHSEITVDSLEGLKNSNESFWDVHGILPDEELQKKLGIVSNRKVMEMTQVYRNDKNIVLAVEVKYIPYERAYPSVEGSIHYAVLPDVALAKLSSYEYISEVTLSAVPAPEKIAVMMNCKVDTPLLLTERIVARQNGNRIVFSRLYRAPEYSCLHTATGFQATDP